MRKWRENNTWGAVGSEVGRSIREWAWGLLPGKQKKKKEKRYDFGILGKNLGNTLLYSRRVMGKLPKRGFRKAASLRYG